MRNALGFCAGLAITTTQRLVESFTKRTKTANCREITHCDFSKNIMLAGLKYFATGKIITCFTLADKWAPEAFQSAIDGLSEKKNNFSQEPISCSSLVAKEMGAGDEEMIMVAGFAGGIGFSGNACGALGAAIWMKTLAWCRENPKKDPFFNPGAKNALRIFCNATGSEFACHKICGKRFNTLDEHTEFIKKGGCKELINALAQS
jgi:type IV secretory pathway TrbD component